MKIDFLWHGMNDNRERMNDGLFKAMETIEEDHEVNYKEPTDDIDSDIVLYWEAPCTYRGEFSEEYKRVLELDLPTALLFAGGPLQEEWVDGFDLAFVESEVNEQDFEETGVPYKRAFGINDEIFQLMDFETEWTGVHHCTCASWKRVELLAEALQEEALVFGKFQPSDPRPFQDCENHGAEVRGQQSYSRTAELLNKCEVLVQTSSSRGGGQRATLEAMACGLPVIAMEDSPKNKEFVIESENGVIAQPNADSIRQAVDKVIREDWSTREYIENNWTAEHYANSLLEGIEQII